MQLICKSESIYNGKKIMQFSKGKEYFSYLCDDENPDYVFTVIDDNGKEERFYSLHRMFNIVSLDTLIKPSLL